MPHPIDKLGLHSFIIPSVRSRAVEVENNDDIFDCTIQPPEMLEDLYSAVIFDCRALPSAFVMDTGKAAFDEALETKQQIRLPFETCYFEFEHTSILAFEQSFYFATENYMEHGGPNARDTVGLIVVGHCFGGWKQIQGVAGGVSYDAYQQGVPYFEFINGFDFGVLDGKTEVGAPQTRKTVYPGFLTLCDTEAMLDQYAQPMQHHEHGQDFGISTVLFHGSILLLGVLALLNEKLLAQNVVADPAPRLTAARAKKGLPPLTAESRVLTINVAAVRNVVRGVTLQHHESPALHWRRGHWRHLHRGSEFEKRAWVRRCLVGDPEKGYVGPRDFKLVWHQPMIVSPTPP
jgi:hypothetical protein